MFPEPIFMEEDYLDRLDSTFGSTTPQTESIATICLEQFHAFLEMQPEDLAEDYLLLATPYTGFIHADDLDNYAVTEPISSAHEQLMEHFGWDLEQQQEWLTWVYELQNLVYSQDDEDFFSLDQLAADEDGFEDDDEDISSWVDPDLDLDGHPWE